MINISNRLKTIANFILEDSNCKKIIDIGCDHALLDIYLIQNNDKLELIASDINKGPLEKAKENITKYSLLNNIKIVLADGLNGIEEKIDTIVISGMGMENITEILQKDRTKLESVNKMVISSNNKFPKLRENICNLGFIVEKEEIVYEEDKFYVVIKFAKGRKEYSNKELYFGPYLINNKDTYFYKYYNYIRDEKLKIIEQLPKGHDEKVKKITNEIEMLAEEINC